MKSIEPSLLAFDLKQLNSQLQEVKSAGAIYIHYDVMDGIFVPNTAFGPQTLLNIHAHGMLSNVHMMVQDPVKWINEFVKFPMNACTFHPEIVDNSICEQAFQILKTHGVKYGIALKTNIDANQYINLLKACDYVSVMSVVPGKGGQSFMPEVMDNLKKVKKIKTELNPRLIIQLDGGVNFDVMRLTKEFVDHYVIGSFLMKQTNKKVVFDFLKNL